MAEEVKSGTAAVQGELIEHHANTRQLPPPLYPPGFARPKHHLPTTRARVGRIDLCVDQCAYNALFVIGLIAIQVNRGEDGSVPPRVLKQRTIPTAMWFVSCTGSSMMLVVYHVPIWFQAIKGVSAVKSGIMTIPLLLSMILGSIGSGFITARIAFFLLCTVLLSVGAGMITTFAPSTGHAKGIGYQVLYGLGLGFGQPQPNLAAQTVLPRVDISSGIALIMLVQSLGGSVFLVVGGNIFTNRLISALSGLSIEGLDAAQLAYNDALRQVFILTLGISCASVFGSTLMEWRSVTDTNKNSDPVQVSSNK